MPKLAFQFYKMDLRACFGFFSEDDEEEEGDESDESEIETRRYGPVSLPAHHIHHQQPLQLQQQQQQHPLGLSKKEGTPPPPPPRTSRSHARSSSLDLNRYPVLRQQQQQQQQPPPAVPPRYVGSVDMTSSKAFVSTGMGRNNNNPISGLPTSGPGIGYVSRDAKSLQIRYRFFCQKLVFMSP